MQTASMRKATSGCSCQKDTACTSARHPCAVRLQPSSLGHAKPSLFGGSLTQVVPMLTLGDGSESSWHGKGELTLCLPKSISAVSLQLGDASSQHGAGGILIFCTSPTHMMLKPALP